MNEKTWQKNAPSQITLNSIFAALAGVLIVLAIEDSSIPNRPKFIELVLLIFSFLFFVISAEQITNALDEKDVKKYVYYMLWYNLGVILIGFSLSIEIYSHFVQSIMIFLSPYGTRWEIRIAFFIVSSILLSHWIYDTWWLLSKKGEEFNAYFDELEDKMAPKSDPSYLMKKFYNHKKSDS